MNKLALTFFLALFLTIGGSQATTFAQETAQPCPMGGPMMDEGGPMMGKEGPMMGKNKHKMGKHGNKMDIFNKLNLTEEQKQQLKSSREQDRDRIQALREQMMQEKRQMMTMMFDPNVSKSQLLSQQDKVANLQNQLHKIRIENIAEMKEILTPEQKQTLQQLSAQKMQKMQQRMDQKKQKRQQGMGSMGPNAE